MRMLIFTLCALLFIGCSTAPKNSKFGSTSSPMGAGADAALDPKTTAASPSPESAAALAAKPLPGTKSVPDLDVPTDDFKQFLDDMKQSKETPTALRDKFASLVNLQRQSYRAQTQHQRAEARVAETAARAGFLAQQKQAREVYFSTKHEAKENSRFNAEMERVRAKYFNNERAQRSKFEARLGARNKDFESAMHEWTVEFNERYRLYAKQATEKPRAGKAVTGDEFRQLEQMPARPLGTED